MRLIAELGYPKEAIKLYLLGKADVGAIKKPDIVAKYLGPCGER
ncbi:MAG: hypothetical protein QXH91_00120 [Candidatus Bathyarchaeia archaeon]